MTGHQLILAGALTGSFLCNALIQGVRRSATAPAANSGREPATVESGPAPGFIPAACQAEPLATVDPATRQTVHPTGEPNPDITTTVQVGILDGLIEAVDSAYVYPDYNGFDWTGLAEQSRQRVEAGMGTEIFYEEMRTLIYALGDDHSYFQSPTEVAADAAALAGENDYVGIGVLIEPLPESGRVVVLVVFPNSPAEREGLRAHDSLLAVDSTPIVQEGEAYPEWVRGPECSLVVLTVQSPGEAPREVALVRDRVQAPTPILAELVATDDGRRVGYLFLPHLFDETIPGQVEKALRDLAPLDGLILDNRKNTGGSSSVLEPLLGFFISGTVGEFVSREARRTLVVTADPVENSQTVPLVVLVGNLTASFGEIMSGVLRDVGRAQIVGETTDGNVEVLHGYEFEDGSNLWIAAETFDPRWSDADWERDGIIPDVFAPAEWHLYT
ncbi:MAG: S41 family peptidase, partial [Anaerolineales bacterium]